MKKIIFLLWLLLGISSSVFFTYLLIIFKVDWHIARYFEQHAFFITLGIPGVFAGMIIPIVMLFFSFYSAKKKSNWITRQEAVQLTKGFFVAYFTSSLLKVLTNRVDMEPFEALGTTDFSGYFRFGFFQANNWWESLSEGWPSGHSLIATYFFTAFLKRLSAHQNRIHFAYILWIMLSVVTAFHWFSDIVSGVIIGTIIGIQFQLTHTHESNHSN